VEVLGLIFVIALVLLLAGVSVTSNEMDLKVAFDLTPIKDISADLVFRAPTIEDRPVLHEIMNDPDVVAANEITAEGQQRWKLVIDDPEISAWRRAEWLVGVTRETGEIVGLATVGPVPAGHTGISIGLTMREGYRKAGYGTQLAAAMLTVLHETFLFDIWAFTTPTSTAVQRILQRLGYSPEAESLHFNTADDQEREWIAYRCGRREGPPDPAIWA